MSFKERDVSYGNNERGEPSYGPHHGWGGRTGRGFDREHGTAPWHHALDRALGWLRARPGESWAFFAAGIVLALLIG